MDLVIYTAATDLSGGFVTSKTDLTAVTDLGTLVFGDSEPLTLKFTTAADGTAPAWLGDNTYSVNVSLGLRGSTGENLFAATNDFTFDTDTYSGHLQLSSADLASWVNARRAGLGYLSLAVSVTTPSNGTETYAETLILVQGAIPAVGSLSDTPVAYATYADALAAQTAAEASATSASNSATAATNAKNAAQAAQTAAESAETNASADRVLAQTAATTATTKAAEASSSASDADADRIAAQSAKTDAEAAAAAAAASAASITGDEASAAASAAAALASEQAAAASEAAAAASESAAALSESNAAASESAAAASATTALNAIAQAFKGGIAGNSVPATSTLAGDYYRITSAGTSQSITWAIGDAAIYNGTSGSWTQLSGYFAGQTDITLQSALIRQLRPRRISDAATSNRAERVQYGTVGALASAPYAYLESDNTLVPASAPSSNIILAAYTTSATSAPTGQAHSLVWYIEASTGYLVLLETGATPATDYRRYASDASICTGTAYRARLTAAITGGSTTAPVFKTAGATIAGTETTGAGTDPDWLHASLVNTWTLYNYNAPAGDVPDVRIYNALWSDTEGNTWTAGGPRPGWAERPGNMVPVYQTDFSSSTGWFFSNGSASITGGQIQYNGASDVNGVLTSVYNTLLNTPGTRVRFTFTASTSGILWVVNNSAAGILSEYGTNNIAVTAGVNVIEGTLNTNAASSWGFRFRSAGGAWNMDDLDVKFLGAFDAPITQPGRTTGDAFARFSRRLVGITSHPLTDRGTLYLNTATSGDEQALGGALFDSTEYVLDGPIEQLTRTGTPTTKIGHTSGGAEYKTNAAITAGINVLTAVTRKLGGTSVYVGSSDTTKVRTVIPYRRLTTPAD